MAPGRKRYGTAFTVIMIDLDNFKDINDTFGHGVGDAVLVRVSDILLAAVRETDIVGRWGGEEFMLICPETAIEEARKLACAGKSGDPASPGVGHLTASFGLADYEADAGPAVLVARADEAMYQAKQGGRNQVVIAPSRQRTGRNSGWAARGPGRPLRTLSYLGDSEMKMRSSPEHHASFGANHHVLR